MKLVTTEQIRVVRVSKDDEVLRNLSNTIDLKDYFAKIKYRKDNDLPTTTLPDYYILKKQFSIPEYQVTFSNKSMRISIRSYINLLVLDYSIKPIHISKNIILNKLKKLDGLNIGFVPSKNTINLKDYIYNII